MLNFGINSVPKKTRKMDVRFPVLGENRGGAYAQEGPLFSSLKTKNVRNRGPLERRGRGGTRPMLTKYINNDFGTTITGLEQVSYIDDDGNLQYDIVVIADGNINVIQGVTITTTISYLQTEAGAFITTEAGDFIIYQSTVAAVNPIGDSDSYSMVECGGKLYIASTALRVYDPRNGTVVPVTNAPASQPLVSEYQERIVVAGEDHMFYASRQGDHEDWDFGDDKDDAGKAIAGFVGDSGRIGGTIKCMLNYKDKAFIMGTSDDLWVIYGAMSPNGGGKKQNISHNVGIIAPRAATITPNGMLVFLSRDGLYTWQIGSDAEPQKFSANVIPQDLRDVSVTTNDISMVYDHKNEGINLFITPATGVGENWWLDLEQRALFADVYPATQQPLLATQINMSGYSDVILASKDGYLRRHSNTVTTDDGTTMNSELAFGPFHISHGNGMDGMITEIISDLADNSSSVTWRILVADTAEEVADNAETAFAAAWAAGVHSSDTWTENHNRPKYPRSRGAWAVLWLSGTGRWSFESITLYTKQLGRLR